MRREAGRRGKRRRGLEEPRAHGQRPGRGARRRGRRAPGRPFHVGPRAGTEAGRVNGGVRVAAEAGPGVVLTGTGGRREGGGRAGQGRPGVAAPQARGSMPGAAAPEVAGAGHSGAGGHGNTGSQAADRKSSGPGGGLQVGRGPAGTKKPGALGGTRQQGPRSKWGETCHGVASSSARKGHWEETPPGNLVSPNQTANTLLRAL